MKQKKWVQPLIERKQFDYSEHTIMHTAVTMKKGGQVIYDLMEVSKRCISQLGVTYCRVNSVRSVDTPDVVNNTGSPTSATG